MSCRLAVLLSAFPIVLGCLDLSGEEPGSTADSPPSTVAKAPDVRAILQAGKSEGRLPEGMIVRVTADAWKSESVEERKRAEAEGRAGDTRPKLKESWEITSDRVHQIVRERVNNEFVYQRVKSLPFDSKNLCRELLDGKLLTIYKAEGEGEPMQFVGTEFDFGHRSIEVVMNGETVVILCESCLGPGYPESDAKAFAALYERLAKQARAAFKPKTDQPGSPSEAPPLR